ncbi:uncharacterized protein LOC134826390 [Bolinopsis microptera]|uniref:uncharacterized protein LOC134826390 n=1 Tax=Bolinopsis microptera TaxID=2820187 RepID=UPI00307A4318
MSKQLKEYDLILKLLLVGDSSVGKSCIMLRYSDDLYTGTYISTIGVDFKVKTVQQDGLTVKLMIWDTAGQEKFRSITASYYRDAHAVMVVYDTTRPSTFDHVHKWLIEIESACQDIVKILVGNKADSPLRKVSSEKGEECADQYSLPFYETSAKLNLNITEAFTDLVDQALEKKRAVEEASRPRGDTITVQKEKKKQSKECSCKK